MDTTWMEAEPMTEELGRRTRPSPLCTTRLKPYRQVTKGVILNLTERGDVWLEFVKKRERLERVVEVFVVSANGTETWSQSLRSNSPVVDLSLHTMRHYPLDQLPEKFWRKYTQACKFVQLLKSKTPKVTLKSDRAKGLLMEDCPATFEARFFDKGPMVRLREHVAEIGGRQGASHTFDLRQLDPQLVTARTLDLIHHSLQLREQCVRLEGLLNEMQPNSEDATQLFPVVLGGPEYHSLCSSAESTDIVPRLDLFSSADFSLLWSMCSTSTDQGSQPDIITRSEVKAPELSSPPSTHAFPCHKTSSLSPVRHFSPLDGRRTRCQISAESGFGSEDSASIMKSVAPPVEVFGKSHWEDSHLFESEKTDSQVASHQVLVDSGLFENVSGEEIIWEPSTSTPFKAESKMMQNTQPIPIQFLSPIKTIPRPYREDLSQTLNSTVPAVAVGIPSKATPSSQHFDTLQELHMTSAQRFLEGPSSSINSTRNGTRLLHLTRRCSNSDLQGCNSRTTDWHTETPRHGCISNTGSDCNISNGDRILKGNLSTEEGRGDAAVLRELFVDGVGWVSQLSDGFLWVLYNDGCQLGVRLPLVRFVDGEGQKNMYQRSDELPAQVRHRLEGLDCVIQSFQRTLYSKDSRPNNQEFLEQLSNY